MESLTPGPTSGRMASLVVLSIVSPFHSWTMSSSSEKTTDGGDDLHEIITSTYSRYCVSNPLHPDVFPAVRKMEAEIVSMCLKMYNAPSSAAGAMTSGGTESIIMAVKTYRDWARKVKGITEPEM